MDPLSVKCPACGAETRKECGPAKPGSYWTGTGKSLVHTARKEAAMAQGPKDDPFAELWDRLLAAVGPLIQDQWSQSTRAKDPTVQESATPAPSDVLVPTFAEPSARVRAMDWAVVTSSKSDTADDVVARAQAYYKWLTEDSSK